jgi:hypothetical protein
MGNLSQEALGCCDDLVKALATVEAEVLRVCDEPAHQALKLEFFNLRIRVGQIRARVPSSIVCAEVKEPQTLQQIQRARMTSPFPDHPVSPPPPDFFEGVNA